MSQSFIATNALIVPNSSPEYEQRLVGRLNAASDAIERELAARFQEAVVRWLNPNLHNLIEVRSIKVTFSRGSTLIQAIFDLWVNTVQPILSGNDATAIANFAEIMDFCRFLVKIMLEGVPFILQQMNVSGDTVVRLAGPTKVRWMGAEQDQEPPAHEPNGNSPAQAPSTPNLNLLFFLLGLYLVLLALLIHQFSIWLR